MRRGTATLRQTWPNIFVRRGNAQDIYLSSTRQNGDFERQSSSRRSRLVGDMGYLLSCIGFCLMANVPEPASVGMMVMVELGIFCRRRRSLQFLLLPRTDPMIASISAKSRCKRLINLGIGCVGSRNRGITHAASAFGGHRVRDDSCRAVCHEPTS